MLALLGAVRAVRARDLPRCQVRVGRSAGRPSVCFKLGRIFCRAWPFQTAARSVARHGARSERGGPLGDGTRSSVPFAESCGADVANSSSGMSIESCAGIASSHAAIPVESCGDIASSPAGLSRTPWRARPPQLGRRARLRPVQGSMLDRSRPGSDAPARSVRSDLVRGRSRFPSRWWVRPVARRSDA